MSTKEVLRDTIQEIWEIHEIFDPILREAGYHFKLVCTNAYGDKTEYECHTIDEAHHRLNAIAQEYDRKGHVLGIA